MNSSIYNDKAKLLTALNKMSKGRGKPFLEGWFYKLNNATIPDNEKTWEKMVASFKMTFYPFDIQNKARRIMKKDSRNVLWTFNWPQHRLESKMKKSSSRPLLQG